MQNRQSNSLSDFLTFRVMVTPLIIQIIFWVGVAGSVIAGLVSMVGGLGALANSNGGVFACLGGIIGGLIVAVVGTVVTRIYCELLILLFRIYDALKELNKKP
jgi:hypothetical protein